MKQWILTKTIGFATLAVMMLFACIPASASNPIHPDGTIVRDNAFGIYLIEAGYKKLAPTMSILYSHYPNAQIRTATSGDLELPLGLQLSYRTGTVLKAPSPGTIYLVTANYCTYPFRSMTEFNAWSSKTLQEVATVPANQIPEVCPGADTRTNQLLQGDHSLPGAIVSFANQPGSLYLTVGNDGDTWAAFPSAEIYKSWGFTFNGKYVNLNCASCTNFVEPMPFREGTLLKGTGPAVYIVDQDDFTVGSDKRPFSSANVFLDFGYHFNEVVQVNDSQLPANTGDPV